MRAAKQAKPAFGGFPAVRSSAPRTTGEDANRHVAAYVHVMKGGMQSFAPRSASGQQGNTRNAALGVERHALG